MFLYLNVYLHECLPYDQYIWPFVLDKNKKYKHCLYKSQTAVKKIGQQHRCLKLFSKNNKVYGNRLV